MDEIHPPLKGSGEPRARSPNSSSHHVLAPPILPVTTPTLEQRQVSGEGSDRVVVVSRNQSKAFRQQEAAVLQATEEATRAHTALGRAIDQLKHIIVGRPLATEQQAHERLTKTKALAVLSSDAISSVAYATEASLGVLILAGAATLRTNLGIALAITLLMTVVGISYRQTIAAYPSGGGSYIVAKDNLGLWPGLIAAAALLIDYVLTVSVSVSAGIDALVSAVPSLGAYAVLIGVSCTLLIMVVNLRGVRESASIFAVPTYLFIVGFLAMIAVGMVHAALSPGGLLAAPIPAKSPAELGWTATETFGILLVLKAFASGCSAMTGVEAISNGVPAFKAPEWKNAQQTLTAMVAILVTLYLGTTFLAWRFGALPYASGEPTVDSQIANLLFSGALRPIFFYIQLTTLLILVLAANTSYADFPRLASILARDKHLPSQFAFRGDRLAFSTGIIMLTALAIALQIALHGNTALLINLYALGVFTAFTLSQAGMVVHWWRLRERGGAHWRRSMLINGLGAIATAIVTVVIGISKFWGEQTIARVGDLTLKDGAWIVLVLAPLLVFMFSGIHRHYTRAQARAEASTPLQAEEVHPIAIVPISNLNALARRGIAYGLSVTPHVYAVHVLDEGDMDDRVAKDWDAFAIEHASDWERQAILRAAELGDKPGAQAEIAALRQGPHYVSITSPSHKLVSPMVTYVRAMRDANPHATVLVVVPEVAPQHWWGMLLYNQVAFALKFSLYREPRVIVANIPVRRD